MDSTITENVFLRDWLTFSSKTLSPDQVISLLGLNPVDFTRMDKGRYGYKSRLQYGHIAILFDGGENMGVCCDMSGQGCREFESNTTLPGGWDDLFAAILEHDMNVSRLDVAFDDHTGVIPLDRLEEDFKEYRFVTRFGIGATGGPVMEYGLRGEDCRPSQSFTFGKRGSKIMFRIYNKAAERGFTDDTHWVRFEMQLRDDRAMNFLMLKSTDENGVVRVDEQGRYIPMPVGEAFSGVVLNYLRFVEPSETDSNKRRWPMSDYWTALVGSASAIRLYSAPGVEYNAERAKQVVQNHWGNAIAAVMEICGSLRKFEHLIGSRKCKPNKKYEAMLTEYFADKKRQEHLAVQVALQMSLDREEAEYLEDERLGMEKEIEYDDFGCRWSGD